MVHKINEDKAIKRFIDDYPIFCVIPSFNGTESRIYHNANELS